MAKKVNESVDLVALVESATEKDLVEIDRQIEDLKVNKIADLERKLQSLQDLRKVVYYRLHGKPKRQCRRKKGEASSSAKAEASKAKNVCCEFPEESCERVKQRTCVARTHA